MRFGSLFTGGGGADLGAQAAGLISTWGVEKDARIVEVAQQNGIHAIVADVCDVDYAMLPPIDVFHASPPCVNFSTANPRAGERESDQLMAHAIARAIEAQMPKIITIENVPKYQYSLAFRKITETLLRLGYEQKMHIVDFYQFGVPQTRRRLFHIARRDGGILELPQPSPGGGWWEAVKDILPHLERSTFIPRQAKYLKTQSNSLVSDKCFFNVVHRAPEEPAFCATKNCLNSRILWNDDVLAPNAAFWKRLQTFPDWYQLPATRPLVSTILGNAVPPEAYRKIIAHLTQEKTLPVS